MKMEHSRTHIYAFLLILILIASDVRSTETATDTATPLTPSLPSQKNQFDDVVTSNPCNQKTCHLKNDIITCCYLDALNNLGQVSNAKVVSLPKTIRLHIVKIKDSALCTDADKPQQELLSTNTTDKCKSGYTLTIGTNAFFKRIKGLTVTKTSLQYISESFFQLFPRMKHLVVDKNPHLKEIPAINRVEKRKLETISYIGNTNVQIVKWNEASRLPALREFLFSNFLEKAGTPTHDFYMGPFTPGKKFKAFKIRLNYQNAHVTMPNTKPTSKLNQVYIGSTNIPENLHLNYTTFQGHVKETVFNLPTKPEQLIPDFLPKGFNEKLEKVSLRFDNENYELKNSDFRRKVSADRQIFVTSQDEAALLDVKREYGAPKTTVDSRGRYVVKYFILDTSELSRLVKDSHNMGKKYVVQTQFMWIRNVNYLRKSVKLHLTFHSLILSDDGIFFSASDVKPTTTGVKPSVKNKEYTAAKNIPHMWGQFDLAEFYDYLIIAASLSEAIQYGNNFEINSGDSLKMRLATCMVQAVKEKGILNSAAVNNLPASQISFIEDSILKLQQLLAFAKRPHGKTRRIADVTVNEFQEMTVLFQEMAKTLITSERYERSRKRVASGLKLLSDLSKLRIDVLRGSAETKMERALADERESRKLLKKMMSLRKKYLAAIQPIKNDFFASIRSQSTAGKYEEVARLMEQVFDLFVTDTSNTTKRKHIPRPRLLTSMDETTKKISYFLTSLESIQTLVASKYLTRQPRLLSNGTSYDSATYLRVRASEIDQNRGFNSDDALSVTSQLNDVKINDIFLWDTVMQRIDKLLDLTLSTEVPETLAFKTSLLRIMDAAKVETEVMYDVTNAQANIFIGNYTIDMLKLQSTQLSKVLNQLPNGGRRNAIESKISEDLEDEFRTMRQFSIFQLKLDMLFHVHKYCSFVEYQSGGGCLLEKQFSFDASLPNILYLTNELLVVSSSTSVESNSDIAPQSFYNVPLRYEFNEQCSQVMQAVENAYSETKIPMQQLQQYNDPIVPQPQPLQKPQSSVPEFSVQQPVVKDTQPSTNEQENQTSAQPLQPATKLVQPVGKDISETPTTDTQSVLKDTATAPTADTQTVMKDTETVPSTDTESVVNGTATAPTTDVTEPTVKDVHQEVSDAQPTPQQAVEPVTTEVHHDTENETQPTSRRNKLQRKKQTTAKTLIRDSPHSFSMMEESNAIKKTNISQPHMIKVKAGKQKWVPTLKTNGTKAKNFTHRPFIINDSTDQDASLLNMTDASEVYVREEKDELMESWINERLGIPKFFTENSDKRSHFSRHHHNHIHRTERLIHGRKPVRTLHGVRFKRTTERPTKRKTTPHNLSYKRFSSDVYNEAISTFMKRSLVGSSREQFESTFRKCNASKIFELKENNMVTLTISPSNKQFKGFERVRVEEVKVHLHGAETTSGYLEVNIKSESIMHDRVNGKKRVFAGKHWNRNFRYHIGSVNETSSEVPFEIRADIHEGKLPQAFYPTPFTTWIIYVSSERNPGLDLSKLASIELLFSGSLVSSTSSDSSKENDFFKYLKTKKLFRPTPPMTEKSTNKKTKIIKKRARVKSLKRKNLQSSKKFLEKKSDKKTTVIIWNG